MALIDWPVTLPDCFLESSWQEEAVDTNIQTVPDTGPIKTRRRYTQPETLINGSMVIDGAQYQTLQDFYNVTLQNGTQIFDFTHPITQAITEYRFEKPPAYSPFGGLHFTVAMTWREMA